MAKSIASACLYSDTVIDREDDEDHASIEDWPPSAIDPVDFDDWESRCARLKTRSSGLG